MRTSPSMALIMTILRGPSTRWWRIFFVADDGYAARSRQPRPWVTTLHGRLDLLELQPIFNVFRSVPVVSISDAQRKPVPQAHWIKTVHHGMPERLVVPIETKRSYLAFLGRITPEKGID